MAVLHPVPRSPGLRALALLPALLSCPGGAPAQSFVVSSWGGAYGASQREAYFAPFAAAAGIRVVEDDWGGDLARIRAMAETGSYRSHVFDAESSDVVQGCAAGILEPIDYPRLGISPDDMLPGAAHACGVGNVAWSMVLAFDRAGTRGAAPAGWADFFDLARFPGGRGLRRGAFGNLEIALMADGVAPERVYARLRTPAGVERAFAKLAALAPHVVWWEAGRQPARLLDDGDAVMATAWHGRIRRAVTRDHRDFEIVWRGQLVDLRLLGHSEGPSAGRPRPPLHRLRDPAGPAGGAGPGTSPTGRYAGKRSTTSSPASPAGSPPPRRTSIRG